MSRVRRRRGAVEVVLTRDEAHVLHGLATQVAELLRPDEPPPGDPLAALVDLPADPVRPPDDPALRRLLPDAYGDAAAAGEFRRLTDAELRHGKVAALTAVAGAVAAGEAGSGDVTLRLADDDVETWLRGLNDVRLVLGTRLDVTEDLTALVDSLAPDDPRLPLLLAYDWLGWLQESLLHALGG